MMNEISCEAALSLLHERRKTDLPSLKFARMLGDRARCLREGSLIIVTFPPARLLWDASAYGYAEAVHLVSGGTGESLANYLKDLPPGKHIVKGSSLAEGALPPALHPLRKAGFISLTAPPGVKGISSPRIVTGQRPPEDFAPLLEAVHYTRGEAGDLIREGGSFLTLRRGGVPGGCCIVYPNYGEIWEIGAVSVAPEFRRQGLGRELVSHALALLTGENRFVRYQLREDNHPSLALARSLGLIPFMEYSHYEITLPGRA